MEIRAHWSLIPTATAGSTKLSGYIRSTSISRTVLGLRMAQAVCRPVDDVPAARELVLQDPADLREIERATP